MDVDVDDMVNVPAGVPSAIWSRWRYTGVASLPDGKVQFRGNGTPPSDAQVCGIACRKRPSGGMRISGLP